MASNKMDKISSILERIREHSEWIYNTTEILPIYINETNYNEALLEIRDMKTTNQKLGASIDKLAKEIEKRRKMK